jgi:hypothetical protein
VDTATMANRRHGAGRREHWSRSPGPRQPRRIRDDQLFPVQIDGEVLYLAPDSGLIIDCAPHAVATVARTPT